MIEVMWCPFCFADCIAARLAHGRGYRERCYHLLFSGTFCCFPTVSLGGQSRAAVLPAWHVARRPSNVGVHRAFFRVLVHIRTPIVKTTNQIYRLFPHVPPVPAFFGREMDWQHKESPFAAPPNIGFTSLLSLCLLLGEKQVYPDRIRSGNARPTIQQRRE